MISDELFRRMQALRLLADSQPFRVLELPFVTGSRANDHRSNHWGARARTSAAHRMGTQLALGKLRTHLRRQLDPGGLVVRVVRVAPRRLDSHDNVGMALKAVSDGIADALGVNDRDHRLVLQPDQEQGSPPRVRLEFYERQPRRAP